MKSVKELCEVIWCLEAKYSLLDFEIDGVKPWQFRRLQLYFVLSEKADVLEQSQPKLSALRMVASLFMLVKNSFLNNPFLAKKTEIVIFPHERSKLVNNEHIDIYTHYLKKDLNDNNISYTEMERPFLAEHIRKKDSNKRYLDFIILLGNILKFFVKTDVKPNQEKIFTNLDKDLKDKLGIKFDSRKFLLAAVRRFKINYYLYSLLFKKLKPKQINIVIAYAHGDVVKAAKDLGITVNELQHGNFSKFHLGYSFPKRKKALDYFPDNLLVWNQYWKDMIDLPIKKENIKIKPFKYLEKEKVNYIDNKKIKNTLIILSQGAISQQLSKLILDKFNLFENMEITYKLHPGEYERWEENSFLVELNSKENLTIAFDINLHEIFSVTEYQLGVFSTALYEGIEFGCKTMIADLPGVESMQKFIKYHQLIKYNGFYVN